MEQKKRKNSFFKRVLKGFFKGSDRKIRRGLDQRGWTLIELMLVTALIAIITPALTYLFAKVSQGMAGDEMRIQLQRLNEQTMLRIHERLISGRHLMQGDTSGVSYLGPVTWGMSANTKALYPILTGAQLAVVQPVTSTGSFSPVTTVKANFGNSILAGVYDSPQTLGNLAFTAPATVAYNAGNPNSNFVTYGNGTPTTLVLDLYRFFYYYLTSANDKTLRTTSTYRIIEWQSVQYADFNEISDIGDATLQSMAISWLAVPGNVSPNNPSYGVTWAWDPTQSDPGQAFYTLSNGVANLATWPVTISEAQALPLTRISSGLLSNGFFYGISPNSSGWNDAPATVPQFGIASGNYPSGFEVGISGTSTGREVLVRSLLVAQGAAPKVVWNDQTMVNNVRDAW